MYKGAMTLVLNKELYCIANSVLWVRFRTVIINSVFQLYGGSQLKANQNLHPSKNLAIFSMFDENRALSSQAAHFYN